MLAAERPLCVATLPSAASPAPAGQTEAPRAGAVSGAGDVLLTAGILLVALLPFICDRAGIGHWGPGTLGLAAVGAVLAARELFALMRASRARQAPAWPPSTTDA
jgi:hypothetical protein